MAIGPGIYDDVCTKVREEEEAEMCCLIIGGGKRGNGMSLQLMGDPSLLLPTIKTLRLCADQLEKDFNQQMTAQA